MRKFIGYLTAAAFSLLFATAGYSAVVIQVSFDFLTLADGVTPIPNGSKVHLIASNGNTNTTLDPATATSFVGGDDVLLGSTTASDFGVPAFVGTGSGSVSSGSRTLGTDDVTTGDNLFLRWWPTLVGAETAPGAELGKSLEVMLNSQVPADGSNTSGLAGFSALVNIPNSTGATPATGQDPANVFAPAQFVGVIPEPSSILLLALGFSAFFVRRRSA